MTQSYAFKWTTFFSGIINSYMFFLNKLMILSFNIKSPKEEIVYACVYMFVCTDSINT